MTAPFYNQKLSYERTKDKITKWYKNEKK